MEKLSVAVEQMEKAKDLPLPKYMSAGAAGMDLYACTDEDIVLSKGDIHLLPTGLKIALPLGYEAQIRPRSGLALKHGINLKPVMLFKAQKLIKDSLENKANFHRIIENLTEKDLRNIKEKSKIGIIQTAFDFYKNNSFNKLIQILKINFAETNCISVNEENLEKKSLKKNDLAELVEQQFVLNSLEDNNNPIRAIFAVNKLNEGWDVLNLFDIVRLYKTRDSKAGKPGKTTTAEAQLIGRGARYFPFKITNDQDRFKRKYDIPNNINELKIVLRHSLIYNFF
jgi:type III restriction enzyme